ncbi:MAG: hypothetical protein J5680_04250, partial [Neisseriaceae bacterium]|nr:hypothetical protein [Neisseriaceae bacterium]
MAWAIYCPRSFSISQNAVGWVSTPPTTPIGVAVKHFRLPENEPYFDAVKIFICKANKGLRSNQGEV